MQVRRPSRVLLLLWAFPDSLYRKGPSLTLCRWPVIAAIVVASLIVLSLLTCLVRCLCCGVECCCGCFACCNACCPSPRGTKTKYVEAPQQPQPYPAYPQQQPYQYQNHMAYGAPQFATFDNPTGAKGGRLHEDALPVMPSWETSQTRRVEEPEEEGQQEGDIAMSPLREAPAAQPQLAYGDEQRQPMLPQPTQASQNSWVHSSPYPSTAYEGGDLGNSQQPNRYADSEYGYGGQNRQLAIMSANNTGSTAPPSYHTRAASSYPASVASLYPPSTVSPVQQQNQFYPPATNNYNSYNGAYAPQPIAQEPDSRLFYPPQPQQQRGIGRKPVGGGWS